MVEHRFDVALLYPNKRLGDAVGDGGCDADEPEFLELLLPDLVARRDTLRGQGAGKRACERRYQRLTDLEVREVLGKPVDHRPSYARHRTGTTVGASEQKLIFHRLGITNASSHRIAE